MAPLPNPLMQRLQEMLHGRTRPPMHGELMAPAHHQHRFQEMLHGRMQQQQPMHGESFGGGPQDVAQEPLAALAAALDTRTHGPIPGMVGENAGAGGLGLALGERVHLPAPPPPGPGPGIHWFGPGGSGIAYPNAGPDVLGGPHQGGPIGSHGEVYSEPLRRRPALANALQVS